MLWILIIKAGQASHKMVNYRRHQITELDETVKGWLKQFSFMNKFNKRALPLMNMFFLGENVKAKIEGFKPL